MVTSKVTFYNRGLKGGGGDFLARGLDIQIDYYTSGRYAQLCIDTSTAVSVYRSLTPALEICSCAAGVLCTHTALYVRRHSCLHTSNIEPRTPMLKGPAQVLQQCVHTMLVAYELSVAMVAGEQQVGGSQRGFKSEHAPGRFI
jgi:hypothetical protein